MGKQMEYLFKTGNVVHLLQLKPSKNAKLGLGTMVNTYHWSMEQIQEQNFKLDSLNCLGCPFSFSSDDERSGKCYTHKGLQRLGLDGMLKRLGKVEKFNEFNLDDFKAFFKVVYVASPSLVRFGNYGEPSLLPLPIIKALSQFNSTGYTHAWRTHLETAPYFMASVHTLEEMEEAKEKKFRTFRVIPKNEPTLKSEINCPASKESGKKVTCVECKLCKGFADKLKDIYINLH